MSELEFSVPGIMLFLTEVFLNGDIKQDRQETYYPGLKIGV